MYLIAVIEDNPTDIMLLRLALDKAGLRYKMHEIEDGRSALDSLLLAAERPDIIVTDGLVPRMNIEELLGELKQTESLQEVPVVVISGMRDSQFEQRVREKGAADYIVKSGTLEGWWKIGERLKHTIESPRQPPATRSVK